MISNINTTTTLVDPSYSNVASTEATDNDSETLSTDVQTDASSSDTISLSTRAQKLSAIANEFFNGKPIDSLDIGQLVERVYEYGLISATQYSALGGGQESESEPTATESVVQYIDDLKANLNGLGADHTFGEVSLSELQAALDQSRGIITKVNMEENNTHLSQVIAQSKQVLTQAYDSDQFSSMSEDDKLTMASVIKTLTVIEQLNTKQADNSLASKYANVALY
ncbi:hypothetical protein KO505_13860 [Psychrosphaera sp. F3M07]|uniref:hypothetical protein n=1 Tax=Psychrosphaera sp. F3M07 TaxID=2841560 RepID=UPI001C082D68|nr:hypothetical protein [Psychrosphaera sp. F3M07]MBU2919037.1 hypothetical protein [Psychrosphaera sp. F3M07]